MTDHRSAAELACMAACNDCAITCGECFAHMAGKESPNSCPACCIECAALCRLAADAVSRHSPFAERICAICADSCKLCAEQCGAHLMDHCQACAVACRACETACRAMAA